MRPRPPAPLPERMYPKPVAAWVGVMPIVQTQPSRATATACRTVSWNAATSPMTWSAANEPITTSGSRRTSTAAARPIAAIESRGDGSASRSSVAQVGQLVAHRGGVRAAGDHDDAVLAGERDEPVPRGLQQRAAGAGEVVQELRCARARQRPQPGARAPCGHDGDEPRRSGPLLLPAARSQGSTRHHPVTGHRTHVTRTTPARATRREGPVTPGPQATPAHASLD